MPAADDLAFAHALADLARPLARRWFRAELAVEHKADASPVTPADRAIERALRDRIAQERPDDGILGEEHGREGLDRERVWVVDPIDGTRSFVTGSPLFGTLVALAREGRPVLGVIEVPILGERFAARAGEPARLGDRPLRTRPCRRLEDAYLATAPPSAQPSCAAPATRWRRARPPGAGAATATCTPSSPWAASTSSSRPTWSPTTSRRWCRSSRAPAA